MVQTLHVAVRIAHVSHVNRAFSLGPFLSARNRRENSRKNKNADVETVKIRRLPESRGTAKTRFGDFADRGTARIGVATLSKSFFLLIGLILWKTFVGQIIQIGPGNDFFGSQRAREEKCSEHVDTSRKREYSRIIRANKNGP